MSEPESTNPSPADPAPGPDRAGWAELLARVARLEGRLDQLEGRVAEGGLQPGTISQSPSAGESDDLEHRFASPLLNYLGLLALLVGLALLIGHWMESHLMAAVLLACLSGAALAGAGHWMGRHGSVTFSQTLEGTALGLLYIACYLSYAWGGILLSLAAGFAVMVLAMRRAFQRDSQLVALFVLLAALLGTLLLRSVQSGEGLLFGYLAAVNGGAVWAGARKNWTGLRFLALLGSHLVAGFWYATHPAVQPQLAAAFPILTFLLFVWIVPSGPPTLSEMALSIVNSGGFLAASASLLHAHLPALISWAPLCLAAVHLFLALAGLRLTPLRNHATLHKWLAAFLFAVGLPFALPAAGVAAGWTGEGLLLGWMGSRRNSVVLRSAGNLLALAAAVAVLSALLSQQANQTPGWGAGVMTVFSASIIVRHRLARKNLLSMGEWEWTVHWFLAVLAATLPMLALMRLTLVPAPLQGLAPSLLSSLLWAVYSVGICLAGWFLFSAFLRWTGVGLLLLTAAKVFVVDPAVLSGTSRIASFLALSVFLLLLSYLFQTRRR